MPTSFHKDYNSMMATAPDDRKVNTPGLFSVTSNLKRFGACPYPFLKRWNLPQTRS